MLTCIPQRWSHWGAVRNILTDSSSSVLSPASILLNVTQVSTFSIVGMPPLLPYGVPSSVSLGSSLYSPTPLSRTVCPPLQSRLPLPVCLSIVSVLVESHSVG
jgi:hypothetical protein